MNERVVGFDEAMEMVLREAQGVAAPGAERVDLIEACGRVLAEEVRADRDQPAFDRSTRDGFAVRAEDLRGRQDLQVVGQVRAGEEWGGRALGGGECVEVMTGAPVPKGMDAVLMVEHARVEGGRLRAAEGRALRQGENVVPRGAEARAGEAVLGVGVAMGAAEVALAAACGAAKVGVFRRPTVAIVATGDELVEVNEPLEAWQIRNSNSYGLAALVAEAGGEAVRLRIVRDRREELREALGRARECELVLMSGGVSMGKYDLVEEVLAEAGTEFLFTGVRMQPGKPLVFGRLPQRDGAGARYIFGLPGNPISTQVTFSCFAAPMLRAMCGAGVGGPRYAQAVLGEDVGGKPGLMRVLPARMEATRVKAEVRLVGWQGSGDLAANARANCYVVLPPEVERFAAGDVVTVLLR